MKDFNLKPVSEEKYISIYAELPKDLIGKVYLRNGSNPYLNNIPHHLFDGDGMIHSFQFQENKIIYHNHWIRTYRFTSEKKHKKPLFIRLLNLTTSSIFNTYLNRIITSNSIFNTLGEGTANTNIIYHHGKFLALNEMDKPYELSFNDSFKLKTIGRYDFNGKLSHNINAHPKIDPDTNELITLGYDVLKKMCYVDVFDKNGQFIKSTNVELPKSTIIHDFGVTKSKIIIPDLPIEFSLKHVVLSNFPIGLNNHSPPKIGLLDKKTNCLEWFVLQHKTIIFHIANSWEENHIVFIYAFCYDYNTFDIKNIHTQKPVLSKIIIDTITKITNIIPISKFYGELPIIDESFVGEKADYIYYSKISENGFDAIVKHNLSNNQETLIPFPKGLYGGECAIYNNYIINIVYSIKSKKSRLLIYNKSSLQLLHNIKLNFRIPFGFHGNIFTT